MKQTLREYYDKAYATGRKAIGHFISIAARDRVVVVIPAFNEEKNIQRTIQLIHGTGINPRIIVVNDGSTDRTAEIARTNGCEVYSMDKNVGKSHAVFKGFKEAILIK